MSDWNKTIIEEFRAKGGRGVGHFGDGLLLLTTYGAKSGRPHTTPLAYHRDGDRYVVIASMGGAPRHPAWYHNLVANGEANIEVGTETIHVRATAVPSGPERDRLYEQQCQIMPGFRDYETMTERIIPVVVLERVDAKAARQAA
jgi:deazaflavin-dependent oxidoreductase (nitroreductase family)